MQRGSDEQPDNAGLTRRALLAAAGAAAAGYVLGRDTQLASSALVPAWPASAALRRARVELSGEPLAQAKDPCVVFDGHEWHLFGSGWQRRDGKCRILHARASHVEGPYELREPPVPEALDGSGVAAPGVIVDGGLFHMFLQTDFARLGGRIEHLTSVDGSRFQRFGAVLAGSPSFGEDCIYDAQPAVIGDRRFLVYAAARRVRETEIHLAEATSGSWTGSWKRHGPILTQREVPFHNQVGSLGYEWGLEGPQLTELPGGGVLLTAVCFLAGGRAGTRQRVFHATAPTPTGPYRVMGVPITPIVGDWDGGENGHAASVLLDDTMTLLYQGRKSATSDWGYGVATFGLPRVDW